MDQIGKFMVAAGLGLALVGAILWLGQGIPWLRLGRLPGDLSYQKDGFSVHFPIVTMLAVSALLTLILWLVQAFRR